MQLSWLRSHFENSGSISLLRSPYAAFVVDFLYRQFKRAADGDVDRGGAFAVGKETLVRNLADYLQDLHETDPDVLTNSAEHYIAEWCSPAKRYLRRFLDSDADEPLYELTASTDDVLTFLDHVRRRESQFVGTESRLRRIIETLSDLAVGASEDAATRLTHLQEQRERIDAEIRSIESGGDVNTYHDTAVRERFAAATSDLAQLQGDFRAVEDRFKEITRDVQRRQIQPDATRGQVLGEALDAEDGLNDEDQGVSFNEFVRLILSPAKQEHLERVIDEVVRLEPLAGQAEGTARLRDMVPSLTGEARKVLRTYQRLSTTLRRLLDRDAMSSRQRIAGVLDEIRSLAVRSADIPDRDRCIGLEIERPVRIGMPLERPLWSPPVKFDSVAMRDDVVDDDDRLTAFSDLAMMKQLDWRRLRDRIAAATAEGRPISLHVLLRQDDAAEVHDAVDVMGMIQIAHEDDHRIDPAKRHQIVVRTEDGRRIHWDLPEVTFEPAEVGTA